MSQALFALAGALVGVFGTLAADAVRARREDRRGRREIVRVACAEFTAALVRVRSIAFITREQPGDQELRTSAREALWAAQVGYERLRLVTQSLEAQEAGRRALRHAIGLQRLSEGRTVRDDEKAEGPMMLMQRSLIRLYTEIRLETGVPNAGDVYREPDEWLGFSTWTPTP
jgi:hypothetical protein